MASAIFLCVFFCSTLFFSHATSIPWRPKQEDFNAFMANSFMGEEVEGTALTGSETFPELRQKVVKRLDVWAKKLLDSQSSMEKIIDFFQLGINPVGDSMSIKKVFAQAAKRLAEKYSDVSTELKREKLSKPKTSVINLIDSEYELEKEEFQPLGHHPFPYYGFIPPLASSLIPDAPSVSWIAPCFRQSTGKAVTNGSHIELEFTLGNPASAFCWDTYLLGTVDGAHLSAFFFPGTYKIQWSVNPNQTVAEKWDLMTKGIRVFRFRDDPVQLVVDILDTVLLFLEPMTQRGVSEETAARNIYFMDNYNQLKPLMTSRSQNEVDIDESLIQSGDFLGVIRLDGLDPMLAWAMGSTTGHTTVALRDPDGTLFIAESTSKDSYWPTNGIQITPFKQWIQQAKAADFNVVWSPLSATSRARFNNSAAWDFFWKNSGTDYGYQNMLWGWIDTLKDNYPCVPPYPSEYCLEWSHIEVLFSWIDRLAPSVSNLLFIEAWNKRVGTSGLRPADLYLAAYKKNIDAATIPTIVEQDSWFYQTTRNGKPAVGKSMVCCVFVCNVWKAAGLFQDISDEIQCAEATNFDIYSLDIFDHNNNTGVNRPESCKVDPNNQLCQILGKYSLNLNKWSSHGFYPHYAETCPGMAPDYSRPSDC